MAQSPGNSADVEAQSYAFWKSKGFSDIAVAGILSSEQDESGFDPTAYNPGEGAIGLFQDENGRRTALQNWAAERGLKETDPEAQLTFAYHELQTSYPQALQELQTATDPYTAGYDFGRDFEVAAASTWSAHGAHGPDILRQIQSGHFAGATAGFADTGGAQQSTVPKPPFPKLTSEAQKAQAIAWLETAFPGTKGWYDTIPFSELQSTYDLYAGTWPSLKAGTVSNPLEKALQAIGNAGGNAAGSVLGWAETLGKILSWLSNVKNWERIGLYALGGILLIIVAVELFK